MNLDQVEKKLREAQFFLDRMRDQERRAFGDRDPFDFYLSAFLSAGRSVDYRLRHEQAVLYPKWRAGWDAGLSPSEQSLIKTLVDDRNLEVHESGSGRSASAENVAVVGNMYSDASGTLHVFAPPGTPPAVVQKPAYSFVIAGVQRKVTEACAEYLSLLQRMVEKFKTDHP